MAVQTELAIYTVPTFKDKQAAVGNILTWGTEQWKVRNPNARASFEDYYQHWGELGKKYALAEALIETNTEKYGRYSNPRFLLDAFIPPEMNLDGEAKKEAEELRFRLQLELLKHNLLAGDDPEAESAVLSFVERNDMLSSCMGILPLPVMSALVTVNMYTDATDEQRLQTYMNHNSRSLLSEYLRVTATPRSQDSIDFADLFIQLPDRIFSDSNLVAWQIVQDYFVSQAINLFRDDPTGKDAFAKLDTLIAQSADNEGKQRFLQGIRDEFVKVDHLVIPSSFNREVDGWDHEPSPFPVFRQKYFAHEFAKTHRKLLMGDTGATKTASSFLAMEHVGAKRVTVFGPAKARDTWKKQAEKHFTDAAGKVVFTVEGVHDLQNPLIQTADYVFISNALLASMQGAGRGEELIQLLTRARGTDGIIIDEAHTFKNEGTQGSSMLSAIVDAAGKQYEKQHPGGKPLPIIELTATPISNSIEDLDVLLGILYPGKFALPGAETQEKGVFSKHALRDPKLAYTMLFGEKLLMQWTTHDIFGDKIPELKPERVITSMRPYERVIYEWMANFPMDPLRKMNVLINVLLNPNLVKEQARKNGWGIEGIPEKEALLKKFDELYQAWQKWTTNKPAAIPFEPFSADWIAKFLGADDLFLVHTFFSEALPDGIFSLAQEKQAIDPLFKVNWETPETTSTKYEALRDIIESRLTVPNQQGKVPKFFVVSPFRRGAVTGHISSAQEHSDTRERTESLLAQMKAWFPDMETIPVDGTQSFAKRAEIADRWRADGTQPTACVASMQAVFESGDWSVKSAEHTSEINVIFLGWPWGWDDFKQMSGRFLRPGLAVPVNIHVLENDNTIDSGLQKLVRMKHLLTQMALFGIRLGEDDQRFFDESLAVGNVLASQRETQQFYVRQTYDRLRGRGEVPLRSVLERKIEGGRINGERIAEFYYEGGLDAYRTVGFNAQHVSSIALQQPATSILSVGAGTCLFARKMRAAGYRGEIVNYDMNAAKLDLAAQHHPEIIDNGKNIVGVASDMNAFASNTFDVVESSYMVDLTTTKNGETPTEAGENQVTEPQKSERVKVLLEMRRVAKVGGRIILTLPDKSFRDGQDFAAFAKALQTHFGLKILQETGRVRASDEEIDMDRTFTKQLGWIITAEKLPDQPQLENLDLAALEFSTDPEIVIRQKNGRRKVQVMELDLPEFRLVSPDVFEIINPLTHTVYRTKSSTPTTTSQSGLRRSASPQAENTRDTVHVSLHRVGKNDQVRRLYTQMRRSIEQALRDNRVIIAGTHFEYAEKILDAIIIRLEVGLPETWKGNIEKIRKQIEAEYKKEIDKLIQNGGNRHG